MGQSHVRRRWGFGAKGAYLPLFKVADTFQSGRYAPLAAKRPYVLIFLITPASHSSGHSDTRRSPDVVLMLGQRRRRWPNIKAALGERLVWLLGLINTPLCRLQSNQHPGIPRSPDPEKTGPPGHARISAGACVARVHQPLRT